MARPRKEVESKEMIDTPEVESTEIEVTETATDEVTVAPKQAVSVKAESKPLQPVYTKVLVNMPIKTRLDNRGATEGYVNEVNVIEVKHKVCMSKETAESQNKHIIGTALSTPATPNHCFVWADSENVQAGARYAADTTMMPIFDRFGNQTSQYKTVIIDWKSKK